MLIAGEFLPMSRHVRPRTLRVDRLGGLPDGIQRRDRCGRRHDVTKGEVPTFFCVKEKTLAVRPRLSSSGVWHLNRACYVVYDRVKDV